MHAAILSSTKAPFTVQDMPLPEPGAGQGRIRLQYAALNHRDVWIQQGEYGRVQYPCIVGSDGVGVLDAVGPGVDVLHQIGDQVIINPSLNWGDNERFQSKDFSILGMPVAGTLAEYVCVPRENIFSLPGHLNGRQAAALPLAGVTAYRALFSRAKLKAGERVLITGAGGGVALFALQFAIAAGGVVDVTTGDVYKAKKCLELGAQHAENYKNQDWVENLKKAGAYDLIVDSGGGSGFGQLIDLLAPGGRLVFMGGTAGAWPNLKPQKLFYKQASLLGTTMGSTIDFVAMLAFVAQHELVPIEDSCYPLAHTQAAAERMLDGAQFGKIVIELAV